jgi:hypothetical protein
MAIAAYFHPKNMTLTQFNEVLMPILAEVGVDPGEPAVLPIHKLDQAAASE